MPPVQPTATSGGGYVTPAAEVAGAGSAGQAAPDLATVVAQLQQVVTQLQALVDAMAGQAAISGGGAPGQVPAAGCGCGMEGCSMGAQQVGQAAPGQAPQEQVPQQQFQAPAQAPGQSAGQAPGQSTGQAPPPGPAPAAPAPVQQPSQGGGDVRQRIVQIARAEFAKNVTEDAGNDTDKAGNIVKYRGAVTGPGEKATLAEAWCADFASWVMREAGVPVGKNGQGEDYVNYLKSWGEKVGRWHARSGYTPQPGDMIIYDWDRDGSQNHVAIVTKVEGGKVFTVGGNESDGVRSTSRSLSDGDITGYITPV